jgi:hypothetical protein
MPHLGRVQQGRVRRGARVDELVDVIDGLLAQFRPAGTGLVIAFKGTGMLQMHFGEARPVSCCQLRATEHYVTQSEWYAGHC